MSFLRRHTRTRPARRPRLEVEAMEARSLLSTLFVNPTVPQDFHTIQSAVNAANPGDTIKVAPGTYHETVLIQKTLNLLGAQAGVNPITGLRSNPANESTVDGQIAIGSTANVRVDGFSVNDPGSIPLIDERTNGDTIANNIVLPGAVDGALLLGNSTHFNDNKIENAVTDGIQIAGSTSAPLNDTIQGNEILGSQQVGIELLAAHGVLIGGASPGDGNSISGSTSEAIDAQHSTSVNVADNLVFANNVGVTFVNSSGNTVKANTVEFNRFEGIVAVNDQADVITTNSVLGNATSGVGSAILLDNTSGHETVENNTVNQNHAVGINVSFSAGVRVTGNTVKNNGGDGVDLFGTTSSPVTGATVSGNTIENNGGNGIQLNSTTGSTLQANTLNNNRLGINVIGSSSNRLIGNVANNNAIEGIVLQADSTGNTMTGNTAVGNVVLDAVDVSTGTGTAGTANIWTRNHFGTDNHGGGLGH